MKLQIQNKSTWSRQRILLWATKLSRFRNDLLQNWPQTPLINLIKKWIRPKDVNRYLWVNSLSDDLDKISFKQWKDMQRKKLAKTVDSLVENNCLEALAKMMKKLLKLVKSPPFPTGVTTEDGTIVTGEESDKVYAEYYRDLFKAKTI